MAIKVLREKGVSTTDRRIFRRKGGMENLAIKVVREKGVSTTDRRIFRR